MLIINADKSNLKEWVGLSICVLQLYKGIVAGILLLDFS